MDKSKYTDFLEAEFLNYYEEVTVKIYRNDETNKFHFLDYGIYGSRWNGDEHICETFQEAFDYVFNYDSFYFFKFKIDDIHSSQIFFYTKKLIEKLNLIQYYSIEDIPIENFKQFLGIEIKLIENAGKKGLKKINLVKDKVKHFFVGKLSLENSMVLIKNDVNEIIFLTSSDKLTIQTEDINEEYYWYFIPR
ncbi:MAG TPA: hypothetical protein PKH16_10680 [Aequorivita sp.]|nr:hypothetical protein [Aequorivita sp.]